MLAYASNPAGVCRQSDLSDSCIGDRIGTGLCSCFDSDEEYSYHRCFGAFCQRSKRLRERKNAGKKKFNNGHCKGDRYHFYCDGTLLLFNHDTSLERQCGRICIQLSFNGVLFCGGGFTKEDTMSTRNSISASGF